MVQAIQVGLREDDFLADLSALAASRTAVEPLQQRGPLEVRIECPEDTATKTAKIEASMEKVLGAPDTEFALGAKNALLHHIVEAAARFPAVRRLWMTRLAHAGAWTSPAPRNERIRVTYMYSVRRWRRLAYTTKGDMMPEDRGKQVGSLWDRFRKKASDAMARQGVPLVRGKAAARDVFDDAGNLLIRAGHIIDEDAIERASTAGKLPALVAAAAGAEAHDLTERLKEAYDRTPAGQDRRNLADSDQYIEARRYIRYIAAVEITDIRGNVLIPAGKVIEDEDVRRMREAGQLAALIYSAQQSGPPPHQDPAEKAPSTPNLPPRRRHATPLSEGPNEDPHS